MRTTAAFLLLAVSIAGAPWAALPLLAARNSAARPATLLPLAAWSAGVAGWNPGTARAAPLPPADRNRNVTASSSDPLPAALLLPESNSATSFAALLRLVAWNPGAFPAAESLNHLTPRERKAGYILLFNGKNLDGWQGNPAVWSVQDGAIVGSTDGHPIDHNTFLVYQKPHSDFILQADVKLRNHNSGIQFRSALIQGAPEWIVAGYQADFSEASDRSAWGNFYEERGRGRGVMKTPDQGWRIGQKLVRQHDWNHYEILAQGHHIRLKLNGVVTIDTTDDKAASGVIAIQLHMGEPMRVECRNVKLKPLAPESRP